MSGIALALDGSTYATSAALLRDGSLIAEAMVEPAAGVDAGGRGEAIVPLIAKMLEGRGVRADEITTVICGAGPGSFTSLRVAASVAKGVAFASGAKMYAVSSLLLTFGGAPETPADGIYLCVIPAMRGELFALPVSLETGVPRALAAGYSIVRENEASALAEELDARIIGAGREVNAESHARGAAALYAPILDSGAIDLHSWEPDYGRLAEAQVKWEALHGRPLKA